MATATFRLGPYRTALRWGGIAGLGLATVFFERLLAAPLAPRAKEALLDLIGGQFAAAAGGLDALLLFCTIMFGMPLLILAAIVSIDVSASGGTARGRWREPAWLIQASFYTAMTIVLMLVAQLDLRPEPLIRLHGGRGSPAYWAAAAALFLATFVVTDILVYWLHRAQHRFAFLWRFHAVHHSQSLDALHNINHPVDGITYYFLAAVPVGFLVRVDAAELLVIGGLVAVQGWLNHMRAPINLGPLGAVLSDNRYHFIHHSRDPADFNSNFAGRFPFIDKMFGTYRARRAELPETGLADRAAPPGLAAHLLAVWPLPADPAGPGLAVSAAKATINA